MSIQNDSISSASIQEKYSSSSMGNSKGLEQIAASTKPSFSEETSLPSVQNKDIDQIQNSTTSTRLNVPNKTLPLSPQAHPHLGANFANSLNQVFNPKEINKGNETAIKDGLKAQGIIDDAGKIDFTKLGFSAKEIKKNQFEGKIWIDDNGKFQVKATGYLGDDFIKAFSNLKTKVGEVAEVNKLKNPITLDPNVLGEFSAEDTEVLERGGQIQYRAYGDGEFPKTLKLVLDPGKDGKDDGLTASVLDSKGGSVKEIKRSAKIPLSVVFEGQALDGKKTDHPLLSDWRANRYFERSEIKTEWFFDKKTSDNTESVGRTQAQNDLWKAVNEYLRWSLNENETSKGVKGEVLSGGEPCAPQNENAGEASDIEMNLRYAPVYSSYEINESVEQRMISEQIAENTMGVGRFKMENLSSTNIPVSITAEAEIKNENSGEANSHPLEQKNVRNPVEAKAEEHEKRNAHKKEFLDAVGKLNMLCKELMDILGKNEDIEQIDKVLADISNATNENSNIDPKALKTLTSSLEKAIKPLANEQKSNRIPVKAEIHHKNSSNANHLRMLLKASRNFVEKMQNMVMYEGAQRDWALNELKKNPNFNAEQSLYKMKKNSNEDTENENI